MSSRLSSPSAWFLSLALLVASSLALLAPDSARAQEATPTSGAPGIAVLAEETERQLIRHAGGESWIPTAPARVVALDPALVDAAVALEVVPVGYASYGNQPYAWMLDQLAGVPIVGDPSAPDLEAIVVAQPDVILLSADQAHTLAFETLDAIAPAIVIPSPQADVSRTLLDVGLILGRERHARERLALYEERLAAAREQVGVTVGDQPVALLSLYRGQPRLYGVTSPPGALYRDLGLTPAALVPRGPVDGEWWVALSTERLRELGAEYLFLMSAEPDLLAELTTTGLWHTVPAVRDGHVYEITNEQLSAWWGNVLGREAAIAQVVAALSGSA